MSAPLVPIACDTDLRFVNGLNITKIIQWLLISRHSGSPGLAIKDTSLTEVAIATTFFVTWQHTGFNLTFFDFQTLLLSKNALLEFSTGRVIDLVSNDVQRLEEDTIRGFFYGMFGFHELVVATFLLVYFIGWQSLMGVIFLCFLLPYFFMLSYGGAELRLRTAEESDRRLSLMTQVVFGIRAIKTHAWEDQHREKIKNIRR